MREEQIFHLALQQAADQRAAFLDAACGSDIDLRERVAVLLRAQENPGSFLQSPAPGVGISPTIDQPTECPGTQIGPYKLLQQIGEGGMGVVYMAEQTEPVQRKVALKVIKPGMDSRQIIARFEAERQALAMMDHVNIARVLDAGATDQGRPYFVMELVHGVPITKYCDDNRLTPRQRLELFVPVCQAIQHAHQKGIIHRDIKPSNVLVTLYDGKPVPKVIDFGVAKATEQKLTERTLFTQYGTMVGTLEYMSPEQAEMSALGVDTRSDIYSLGVLLYELLTGSTPLTHKRMKEAAYAEILRLIKEEEPPKPSTRLSDSGEALASISANRHTEPAKLTKLVRGELDWIVMKCLEKDRGRRYDTANAFAADVERYLAEEPVQACPPSARYRARKFVRRNMRALATTTVLALAVIAVAGAFGWALRDREATAQHAARDRANREEAVNAEVTEALKEAERWQLQEDWHEALSAAKRAEGLLAGTGSDELRERVRLLRKKLEIVQRLGNIRLLPSESDEGSFDYKNMDRAYTQAFAYYGIDVAGQPVEEAAGRIRTQTGITGELVVALDDWAHARKKMGDPSYQTLTALAQAADTDLWRHRVRLAVQQNDTEVLSALASSEDLVRQPPASLLMLSGALATRDLLDARYQVLRKAQLRYPGDFWVNYTIGWGRENRYPFDAQGVSYFRAAVSVRPRSAAALHMLGTALRAQGMFEEALAYYRKALELDPKYVLAYNGLGLALMAQKKFDEAIAVYRQCLELDPTSPERFTWLGNALTEQGKLEDAVSAYQKAIALDPMYVLAHINLSNTLRLQNNLPDALMAVRSAIRIDDRNADAHNKLGLILRTQKKLDEAVTAYRRAIELDQRYAAAHNNLAAVLAEQQKLPEAIAAGRRAIEINPRYAIAYSGLGSALASQGEFRDAIASCLKAIELEPEYAGNYITLGIVHRELRQWPEAVAAFRQAVELNSTDAAAFNNLGNVYYDQQKWDDAVSAYQKSIALRPGYADSHRNLGEVFAGKQKWPEAVRAFGKAIELEPNNADHHSDLSVALRSQGLWAEAIAAQRKAIELAPTDAHGYNGLAGLLCSTKAGDKLRDPAGAVEAAKRAVQLAPKNQEYLRTLAYAEYRAGDWMATIAAFEKRRQLGSPSDEAEWFLRAMAHWQLGDKEAARTCYDQAVRLKTEFLRELQTEAAELMGIELKMK